MHRIPTLLLCLVSCLLPPCHAEASAKADPSSAKPNIVFIAVDDLSNALACYGDPVAKTPHLDRLARSGILFQRAYNQIPLCNPSRASVLTGLRPDTLQVFDLSKHFRDVLPDVVTLPQLFRQNDYFVARVGKLYHYNVPFGIGGNGLDDPPSWDLVVNPKGRDTTDEKLIFNAEPHRPISGALSWLAADGTDEEQTDGMITTQAIKLLKERGDKPFFLGVGFFRPHTPFVAPKKYFDLYPLEDMKLPDAPKNDRDDIPTAAFAHNCPVPHYNLDEATVLKAMQAYYACVSFVDAQVGRILDALDETGLADNTIVVFWSDHGYHLGEHNGIWQKRTLFEEGSRAPLIIRAPKAKGNGTPTKRIVEFIDLYPTLTELAGLKAPGNLPGRSLRPLLDNPAFPNSTWNGHAITQVLRPADSRLKTPVMGRSIRTDRWRYTEWAEGNEGLELYDHQTDPHEFTNLALKPNKEHKAIIQTLKTQLSQHASGKTPPTPFNQKKL